MHTLLIPIKIQVFYNYYSVSLFLKLILLSVVNERPAVSCPANADIDVVNIRNDGVEKIRVSDLRSKTLAHIRGDLSLLGFTPYDQFLNSRYNMGFKRLEYFQIDRIEEAVNVCEVLKCTGNHCTLFIEKGEFFPLLLFNVLNFLNFLSKCADYANNY